MDPSTFEFSPEIIIVLISNLFLFCILLISHIFTRKKLKKLESKYNNFMDGLSESANIEQLLEKCINRVEEVSQKSRDIEKHINDIDRNLLLCVQKIGVIRYNAFENVGSDLSFSVALLDNNDSGLVFSGIYSRESSSTYAKPIINGKSKHSLSAEEIQALEVARKSYRERVYLDR